MTAPVPDNALDQILATQLTVAWAGEGRCSPRRLGWWDTDLIDEAGGGDFFARLLPQTHLWASLEAVREAARRTDAKARGKMADPDKMRTIFFLGFELDEQVGDRLALLKHEGRRPGDALPLPVPLTADFSKEKLIAALHGGDAVFTVVPGGAHEAGSARIDRCGRSARLWAGLWGRWNDVECLGRRDRWRRRSATRRDQKQRGEPSRPRGTPRRGDRGAMPSGMGHGPRGNGRPREI